MSLFENFKGSVLAVRKGWATRTQIVSLAVGLTDFPWGIGEQATQEIARTPLARLHSSRQLLARGVLGIAESQPAARRGE
jgi:hypothetical protein